MMKAERGTGANARREREVRSGRGRARDNPLVGLHDEATVEELADVNTTTGTGDLAGRDLDQPRAQVARCSRA